MTHKSLKQISSFDTVKDVWAWLEKSYASQSRAQVIQIKEEMQSVKKSAIGINDYVIKIKLLADDLDGAGYPLAKE